MPGEYPKSAAKYSKQEAQSKGEEEWNLLALDLVGCQMIDDEWREKLCNDVTDYD